MKNKILIVDKKNTYLFLAKTFEFKKSIINSTFLISSYLDIEDGTYFSFDVEKEVIENLSKEEIVDFIETYVYENGFLKDEDEYKIVYALNDKVDYFNIQVVMVSKTFLKSKFDYLLKKTKFIDYISFPAFSYKALYELKILDKKRDVFIIFFKEKVFVSFYNKGNLEKFLVINDGIVFLEKDIKLSEILKSEFLRLFSLLDIEADRIFVTTEYGNINNLASFLSNKTNQKIYDFYFFKYSFNPLLFLCAIEAYSSYKNKDFSYNFSIFLRKKSFFYTKIVLFVSLILVILAYFVYLYLKIRDYEIKIESLKQTYNKLNISNKSLLQLQQKINKTNAILQEIYNIKSSYKPVSKTIYEITKILNKNNIFLLELEYKDRVYLLKVLSKNNNFFTFFSDLSSKFKISYSDVNKTQIGYITTIRLIDE